MRRFGVCERCAPYHQPYQAIIILSRSYIASFHLSVCGFRRCARTGADSMR